jgi:hypothetical protein
VTNYNVALWKMGDICICMSYGGFVGVWYGKAFFGDIILSNLDEPFLVLQYSTTFIVDVIYRGEFVHGVLNT